LLCLLGARPGCRGALLASSSPGDQRPSGCCAPWMAHNPGLRGFAAITTGLGLYQEGPVGENASCAPSKGPARMLPRCVLPCDRGPLCAAPGERTSACRGSNLWPDRGAKASHQGGSATLPHVQAHPGSPAATTPHNPPIIGARASSGAPSERRTVCGRSSGTRGRCERDQI